MHSRFRVSGKGYVSGLASVLDCCTDTKLIPSCPLSVMVVLCAWNMNNGCNSQESGKITVNTIKN